MFEISASSEIGEFDPTLVAVPPSSEPTPIIAPSHLARLAAGAEALARWNDRTCEVLPEDILTEEPARSQDRPTERVPPPAEVGRRRGQYRPARVPPAIAAVGTPTIAPRKRVKPKGPPPLPSSSVASAAAATARPPAPAPARRAQPATSPAAAPPVPPAASRPAAPVPPAASRPAPPPVPPREVAEIATVGARPSTPERSPTVVWRGPRPHLWTVIVGAMLVTVFVATSAFAAARSAYRTTFGSDRGSKVESLMSRDHARATCVKACDEASGALLEDAPPVTETDDAPAR